MKAKNRTLPKRGKRTVQKAENLARENRWCEKYGYFIDIDACGSRARSRDYCGKCLSRWRQLSFPFMSAT
jgi:hypothetical protein